MLESKLFCSIAGAWLDVGLHHRINLPPLSVNDLA
jgi:hypothetical protein